MAQGSQAYLGTGAPALSQIVSHGRRSLSGVVVMCNPQGEKSPSEQPCPGVTAFPTELITPCHLEPTSPFGDILYTYQPSLPLAFSRFVPAEAWGQLRPSQAPGPAGCPCRDSAGRHWVAQPPALCGIRSQLWFQGASCLLQPRSPVGVGALGRGSLRAATPRLWGPAGLNKAQGHLKRDLGGLVGWDAGGGAGEGREGWGDEEDAGTSFPPGKCFLEKVLGNCIGREEQKMSLHTDGVIWAGGGGGVRIYLTNTQHLLCVRHVTDINSFNLHNTPMAIS